MKASVPILRLQGALQEPMSASTTDASKEAAAEGTQPGDYTSSGSESDAGQDVDIELAAVPETTAATAAPDAAAHAAPALPTEARCLLLQCPPEFSPLWRLHRVHESLFLWAHSAWGVLLQHETCQDVPSIHACARTQEVSASAANAAGWLSSKQLLSMLMLGRYPAGQISR